jgi:hypothetical protein
MTRPTIAYGSSGSFVEEVQACLEIPVDGDFGQQTERAVMTFQTAQRLESDGVVGPNTWAAFESVYDLPPYPPPLLPPIFGEVEEEICELAMNSAIAVYAWRDRGQAPPGYIQGMAIAYAEVVRKWLAGDSSATEMGKADTGNSELDALAWYADMFDELEMDNSRDGLDTLRHLFVLMLGLGMRESSGKHCEGRDMSADWTEHDTAEAGLFQMSWNMKSSSSEMQKLFDQFDQATLAYGHIRVFERGVECSASSWQCYGIKGQEEGYRYQQLAKDKPQFAVETAAVGLRNRRGHWGPINRFEAEIVPEADDMLIAVQALVAPAMV